MGITKDTQHHIWLSNMAEYKTQLQHLMLLRLYIHNRLCEKHG
jgi:hypothetical protein